MRQQKLLLEDTHGDTGQMLEILLIVDHMELQLTSCLQVLLGRPEKTPLTRVTINELIIRCEAVLRLCELDHIGHPLCLRVRFPYILMPERFIRTTHSFNLQMLNLHFDLGGNPILALHFLLLLSELLQTLLVSDALFI
jgi:hypothetical protein